MILQRKRCRLVAFINCDPWPRLFTQMERRGERSGCHWYWPIKIIHIFVFFFYKICLSLIVQSAFGVMGLTCIRYLLTHGLDAFAHSCTDRIRAAALTQLPKCFRFCFSSCFYLPALSRPLAGKLKIQSTIIRLKGFKPNLVSPQRI